jgi:hypothetical protein
MSAPEYSGPRPPELHGETLISSEAAAELQQLFDQTDIVPHNSVVVGFDDEEKKTPKMKEMTYEQDLLVHKVREVNPVAWCIYPNNLLQILEGSREMLLLNIGERGRREVGVTTRLCAEFFRRHSGAILDLYGQGVESVHP